MIKGRKQSDGSASQGMPNSADKPTELEEAKNNTPQVSERAWIYGHFDLNK